MTRRCDHRRWRLFVILIFSLAFSLLAAAPSIKLKGEKLRKSDLFVSKGFSCGKIKGKWLSGRILPNGKFLSLVSESAQLISAANKVSGKQKLKLLNDAKRLRKKERSQTKLCVATGVSLGTVLPTPTFTSTIDIFATTTITSTPLPTEIPSWTAFPTGTPVPTVAPLPSPSPTPTSVGYVETIIYPASVVAGCEIAASNNQYLGVVSSNRYASDSIANTYGSYGSVYSSTSIFNKFGSYGGKFSSDSPFNQYTATPPIIFCGNNAVAYLTVNQFKSPRVDSYELAAAIGRLSDTP